MTRTLPGLLVGLLAMLATERVWSQESVGGAQRGQRAGEIGQGARPGAGQGAGKGMPAQRGQGQGRYQGDMFTLVSDPAVQKELKISAEQSKLFHALGEKEVAREAAEMLAERGSCEKTDKRRGVMAEVRDAIREILNDSQWARLNEIWIQVRGARALQSERIGKDLDLSAEQRRQLAQLLAGGFRGRASQIEEQALEILGEQQRKRFREMQGAPFAVQERRAGAGQNPLPSDGSARD